jgi:hypothetical protein
MPTFYETGMYAYTHEQITPSAEWTIQHDLNKKVVIDVLVNYRGELTKILPSEIVFIDDFSLKVKFSKPMTGSARVT